MIPLSIFLIAWLVLLGIYALLALVSIVQMVRFGVSGSMTYFSTGIYLAVAAFVLTATVLYFLTVDWSLGLDVGSLFSSSPYLSP
jgi:hypothetical protein